MKIKTKTQTRIDLLEIPELDPELSHIEEEELYRFLRGGLEAK